MNSIYILKLEGDKYYIGKSGNVDRRFQDHMSGNGSAWTRVHHPIEIEKVIPNTSAFDEDRYVKEYMALHGVDNVRGGSYVTIELSAEQKEFLKREIWGAQDLCARCGEAGHFIRQCSKPPPPITPISIPRRTPSPDIFNEPFTTGADILAVGTGAGLGGGGPITVEPLVESPIVSKPDVVPIVQPKPLMVEIPPTLTVPNPVFVIKNWFDTSFSKIQNEFTNPDSDLRSGKFFQKMKFT